MSKVYSTLPEPFVLDLSREFDIRERGKILKVVESKKEDFSIPHEQLHSFFNKKSDSVKETISSIISLKEKKAKERIEKIKKLKQFIAENKERKRIEKESLENEKEKRREEAKLLKDLIRKRYDQSVVIDIYGVSAKVLSFTFDSKNYISIIDIGGGILYKVSFNDIYKKYEGSIKDSNGEIKNRDLLKSIKYGLIEKDIKPIRI